MQDDDTSPSLHRRAWDAIPWVAAGSASDEEQRLVAQHIAACADCRDELAFHRGLCAAMLADAPPPGDPDPALQRMWARIDQAQALEPGALGSVAAWPAGAPPVPVWQGHPPPRIEPGAGRDEAANGFAANAPRQRRGGWSRLLASLVLVQAIGLAALASVLWQQPRNADYQTLSRATSSTASIRLVPAAALSIGELRSLLARHGLEIVESSGDGTLLGLAPRLGTSARQDETLARLRSEPGVLLAEPMPEAAATRP